MKKIYGFAFASAALMLASCSNETEPTGPNTPATPAGPNSYLALNINSPAGTRADDDYKIGETNENTVNDAKFIVLSTYDAATKRYGTEMKVVYVEEPTSMTWTDPGNFPNTVEKIGNPVLVIPSSATGAWNNTDASEVGNDIELVVLLNMGGGFTVANGTTKDDLVKMLADVNKSGTAGSFQMSNSTYNKDGQVVYTQVVPTTYLMNSEAAAKNNPVDVYVERFVARADVKKAAGYAESNNKLFWENDNEKEYTLTPVIKGLAFYHDPINSYVLKHTDNWKADWTNDANDLTNFRSYWATMPATADLKFTDFSYNSATATGATTAWDGTDVTKYLAENTLGGTEATKLVVLAELQKDGNAFEMAQVLGQFTDKDGSAVVVANSLNSLGYRVYTGEETAADGTSIKKYRTIAPSDLVWTNKATANTYTTENKVDTYYGVEEGDGNRTYYELATLAGDEKYAKYTGQIVNGYAQLTDLDAAGVAALNNTLKTDYQVSYWNGGKCYYYIDIKHLKFGSDEKENIGVVRNHLYNVVLDGISGFGTPVFNPEEYIIPTPPEYNEKDKVYLAARINIHKWRIVNSNQGVILGK